MTIGNKIKIVDLFNLYYSFQLLDARVVVLVDTLGSGLPVHVGQPGFFNQHRQTVVGQTARQTDNHGQSETRGGQGTDAVVQSPQVGRTAYVTGGT